MSGDCASGAQAMLLLAIQVHLQRFARPAQVARLCSKLGNLRQIHWHEPFDAARLSYC